MRKHLLTLLIVLLYNYKQTTSATSLKSFREFLRSGDEDCNSDVIFVVDESGSISPTQYEEMIQFIKDVVAEMESFGSNDIIYGVVSFSWKADVDISLDERMDGAEFSASLENAIKPQAEMSTRTDLGIENAISDFELCGRSGSKRVMVILTDGVPNDEELAQAAATRAKEIYKITITAVCIGCNVEQLHAMVSEPKDSNIIDAKNFANIALFVSDLANSICPPKGRKICDCDLVFVMDGSSSMSEEDGVNIEQFVRDVVMTFENMGNRGMHFGAVVFSTQSAIRISLGQNMDTQTFSNSISLDRNGLGYQTKTHLGIQAAIGDFQRNGHDNHCWLMVILSDGAPCCSIGDDELAKNAADDAKRQGIEIFSVCIGRDCDDFQLKEMVSDDIDDHYLQTVETSALPEYVKDLVDIMCPDPCFETPADVIFMLDHSKFHETFVGLRSFIEKIAEKVATSSFSLRIGVITFNEEVSHVILPTPFIGRLLADLDDALSTSLNFGGYGSMYPPMKKMLEIFTDVTQKRDGARLIGIMVSDFNTTNQADVESITNHAKGYEGVEMISLSVGAWQNPGLIQFMASEPKDDHIYQLSNAEDLKDIVNLMVKTFCVPSYCVHVPLDVVFVIDWSSALKENFILMAQGFLKDVYARLGIYTTNTRMGVVLIGSVARHYITLENQDDIKAKLNALPAMLTDNTDLDAGLLLMIEQFEMYGNEVAQWMGVVLTNGKQPFGKRADEAREMSIKIISIAIGDEVSLTGLADLAGVDGKVLSIKSYVALKSPPCEAADVIFLIDQTTSIHEADYYVQMQFVIDIAYRLLDYKEARVGAFAYNSRPYLITPLSDENERETFAKAITDHPYFPGMPTYIFYAIEAARDHFKDEGRQGVEHIMIVISDGYTQFSQATIHEAELSRDENIRIAAVAVTERPNMKLLKSIVSRPQNKYIFTAKNYVSLKKLENSVMKLICTPPCKDKVSVVFVIDKSYSIHESLFNETRDLVHEAADVLFDNAPNAVLAAVVFDGRVESTPLTPIASTFHSSLDSLVWPTEDFTKTGRALFEAFMYARSLVPNGFKPVVVLLSDGAATDTATFLLTTTTLQASDVRIVAIGIGPDVNEYMLSAIASRPVRDNVIITKGKPLLPFITKLASMVCNGEQPTHKKICGNTLILTEISMCCNGVPQKKPNGIPGCCGSESYNLNTHWCCNGTIGARDQDSKTCPPSGCYDETKYICCEGSLSSLNGRNMACCGTLSYDTALYTCCNGQVADMALGSSHLLDCCGGVQYNILIDHCCNGVLTPTDMNSESHICIVHEKLNMTGCFGSSWVVGSPEQKPGTGV
ncbi:hypothetical protein CAPTEDRAFT_196447 [Capitella teleta]|uniref:VWFA domain-containing protein n=1 Tax=Capitella teleta TaxID=283909 RepID=R7V7T8_CAPTE|nr:hypothetical protein CAPTEDRAFT_196447 [Capitella teleta]|eukprot:ELU12436.1 hypothetical protein CAPTEDRAFT_196447 [Capitella teleta]